jgi:hypothetical protein
MEMSRKLLNFYGVEIEDKRRCAAIEISLKEEVGDKGICHITPTSTPSLLSLDDFQSAPGHRALCHPMYRAWASRATSTSVLDDVEAVPWSQGAKVRTKQVASQQLLL